MSKKILIYGARAVVNFVIVDDKKHLVEFLAGSNQSIKKLKANVYIG